MRLPCSESQAATTYNILPMRLLVLNIDTLFKANSPNLFAESMS